MRFVSAAEIDALLTFPELVDALAAAFRSEIVTPVRHHHPMARRGQKESTLLLMPAWSAGAGGFMGTKIVSAVPDNPARGKPSIVGVYVLFDGDTCEPLCLMDGPRLTLWRTAAASALAASFLARHDAHRLLMVGSGALAPFLIRAHASAREIRHVRVWNRHRDKAAALARSMAGEPFEVTAADDLAAAARAADVISCATMSSEPLVEGAWLKPGTHLDLVGAYRPTMREADDEAVLKASLFCDTRAGATKEAGDLAIPLAAGLITPDAIRADLFELTRGPHAGRNDRHEVTLFKSVGTAIEDLAAATLVWRKLGAA
jgi:ornithine cyclodeaminase